MCGGFSNGRGAGSFWGMMAKIKCLLCNRNKQESKHHDPRCVCCDVHAGNCRHKPGVPKDQADKGLEIFRAHKWPLWNPLTGKVKRMTIVEREKMRESEDD